MAGTSPAMTLRVNLALTLRVNPAMTPRVNLALTLRVAPAMTRQALSQFCIARAASSIFSF
jgi:hypothetical protein